MVYQGMSVLTGCVAMGIEEAVEVALLVSNRIAASPSGIALSANEWSEVASDSHYRLSSGLVLRNTRAEIVSDGPVLFK